MSQRIITIASTASLGSADPTLVQLLADIDSLYAAVPLTFVHWIPTVNPLIVTHQVKALDTRVWTSTVTFANAADLNPGCTFVVNPAPGWKLTEFQYIRPIRQALIGMAVTSLLTLFKVDYS